MVFNEKGLTVNLPQELKRDFDVKCAKYGKRKKEIIKALIEGWVNGIITLSLTNAQKEGENA